MLTPDEKDGKNGTTEVDDDEEGKGGSTGSTGMNEPCEDDEQGKRPDKRSWNYGGYDDYEHQLGSLVVGKYWDAPNSPDLSLTMSRRFDGIKI